jgi:hypothetical protein
MKVHPVFHIRLLKDFFALTPTIEIAEDIPASNDFVYGDDHYHVHSLLDHKTAPHPHTYAKGPSLLFRVRWEGYDCSRDSWEPYMNVKRTDCLYDYLKTVINFASFYLQPNTRGRVFLIHLGFPELYVL